MGVGVCLTTVDVARRDVDVDHAGGRRERLVRQSQHRGVPLLVGAEVDVVRFGVDGEHRLATVTADDADPGLGGLPLVQREELGERLDRRDPPAGLVGDQLAPVAGTRRRCRHHAEVDGVVVGEDHEAVAPVVDVVLDVRRAVARTQERRAAGSAVGSSQFSDVCLLREWMTIHTLLRVVPMPT